MSRTLLFVFLPLLLVAAPARSADEPLLPEPAPVLVVYDFTSAFDDGSMGRWVADMVRSHARRSQMYTLIDPLTFDDLISKTPFKVSAQTDPAQLADLTRRVFAGDLFIYGEVTRKDPRGYLLTLRAYEAGIDAPRKLLDETRDCPDKQFFSGAVDDLLKKLSGVGEARDEWKGLGEALRSFSAQWLKNLEGNPEAGAVADALEKWSRELVAAERKLTSYRMVEQAHREVLDQFHRLSAAAQAAAETLRKDAAAGKARTRQVLADAQRLAGNIRDWLDVESEEVLWKTAENLVKNGDFAFGQVDPANWDPLKSGVSWIPNPDPKDKTDKCIRMDVSRDIAETTGMIYYSHPFAVEEGATYRFSVAARTAGPSLKVFIKCYDLFPEKWGFAEQPREVYRAPLHVYLPDDNRAGWNTYKRDFVPYTGGVNHPRSCRVMLYAYLRPGVVYWDDVVIRKIKDPPKRP